MSDSHSMERWPDDRLLRAANRGDTEAFSFFCVKSLPGLRRYVRFQCAEQAAPIDLAEDFCHDVIIRAVGHINSCKEHGDRPLPKVSVAWLKQIAFNVICDWRRRNGRITLSDQLEPEAPPSLSPDEIDEYEEILKYFNWLNGNERDMLELVLMDGMDIVEAGEHLNLKKANAYKTYERGLARIRDLCREHGRIRHEI
jgi:RNA polymerase sigma factor (sigma-70 family)